MADSVAPLSVSQTWLAKLQSWVKPVQKPSLHWGMWALMKEYISFFLSLSLFFFFFFLRQSLTSFAQAGVAGITGIHHHTQLIVLFLVELGLLYVGQAGLKLLTSGDLPPKVLESQVVSHCTPPYITFLREKEIVVPGRKHVLFLCLFWRFGRESE